MSTSPQEFIKFHAALMSNALPDYTPWYFPVNAYDKDPDSYAISQRAGTKSQCCQAAWDYNTKNSRHECASCKVSKSSWKAAHARLTYEEALQHLKEGKNVGIAARADDKLVICDIDSEKYVSQLPPSLINHSRKRTGRHGYYWAGDDKVKTNITTDTAGELRSCDEYVLAPGSFVTLLDSDIDKAEAEGEMSSDSAELVRKDPLRGVYTVEVEQSPATITWEQLPQVYRNQWGKNQAATAVKNTEAPVFFGHGNTPDMTNSSRLFQLTIPDIFPDWKQSDRAPHPLHSSDTGKNFSTSNGLAHCWRHLVSLNVIQYLCVKAGYASCNEAGTPHNSNQPSQIRGDKGAIFYAWLQAKKDGLLLADDKIPLSALWYVAYSAVIVPPDYVPKDWLFMPEKVFKKTVQYVEETL